MVDWQVAVEGQKINLYFSVFYKGRFLVFFSLFFFHHLAFALRFVVSKQVSGVFV